MDRSSSSRLLPGGLGFSLKQNPRGTFPSNYIIRDTGCCVKPAFLDVKIIRNMGREIFFQHTTVHCCLVHFYFASLSVSYHIGRQLFLNHKSLPELLLSQSLAYLINRRSICFARISLFIHYKGNEIEYTNSNFKQQIITNDYINKIHYCRISKKLTEFFNFFYI